MSGYKIPGTFLKDLVKGYPKPNPQLFNHFHYSCSGIDCIHIDPGKLTASGSGM